MSVKSERDPAEVWYGYGEKALQSEDLENAEKAFARTLEADPHHANAYYRLGQISEMRSDRDRAMTHYARALQERPGHVSALHRLTALTEGDQTALPALAIQPSEGLLHGRVQDLQQRYEYDRSRRATMVISFRVSCGHGPFPNAPGIIPVEMRGKKILGTLRNGDIVEFPPGWSQGKDPHAITDLTTGERVSLEGDSIGVKVAAGAFAIFVVTGFMIIMTIVIVGAIRSGR